MVELSAAKNTPVTVVDGCAQWEGEATHCRRKHSGLSCYPAPGSMQADQKETPIHPFSRPTSPALRMVHSLSPSGVLLLLFS